MAFIRARQIEDELKHRGTEQGTLYVLQVLAEQQIALQKDMRDAASVIDTMASIIGNVVTMGENMKQAVERLNRDDDDQGLDLNTHQLGQKQ
ncbi:MAG: hypothetical protein KKH61_21250 [Gammaproteobacteria bacterium]|uniref:Uncharacterized protein n=1 Tax=viral metagenome TaxID=1070528 RepID=A0A6H1ZAZ2_9ZZZZ|nr:hypothetical protein [Gammaproteobacteria bacterium]